MLGGLNKNQESMLSSSMSGQGVIDKQGSSLQSSSATFAQQACNQHPHTASVINSDLLSSSFISISSVSALMGEEGS